MPKKRITYSAQTQPPYFQLGVDQYSEYAARAKQRVKELLAVAPSYIALTATTCAASLTHAVIEPRSFDPGAEPDGEENFDAEDDLGMPADRFARFRELTDAWITNPDLGIGSARVMYYFDLFASAAYQHDVADMGGHPRSPHATSASAIRPFGELPHPSSDGRDWLIYDLFLEDALAALGLSWTMIETAVFNAFLASLPAVYKVLLDGAKVPMGLVYVLWRHDIEHWHFYSVHGGAIKRDAEKLLRLVRKTPDASVYSPLLKSLVASAEPASWTTPVRGAQALADELYTYCQNSSPIVKNVNKALDNVVWRNMTTEPISATAPSWVRHIHESRVVDGVRTTEYWMLLADLMYHLPQVRGLPPLRRYADAEPRQFPSKSYNAMRLSVTRP